MCLLEEREDARWHHRSQLSEPRWERYKSPEIRALRQAQSAGLKASGAGSRFEPSLVALHLRKADRPGYLRAPPIRFRSAHTQLRNRLAYITTRENSPSDHLCQIVPVKRPSHAGTQPNARIVNGKPTFHSQSILCAQHPLGSLRLLGKF